MEFFKKIIILTVVILLFIKVSSSSGSSSAKKSFTESLFDDPISKKIRQEVLRTNFFRGIVANNLAPDAYGGFMVQDAVFIYDVADLLSVAAANVQRLGLSNFAAFYRNKSASFSDYGRYFSENWKILPKSPVNMSVAASTYISYEKNLTDNDPKRLVIGLLACSMLWPWLAQKIDAKVPSTHVYRSWVDDNLPSGSSHTQEFVNKFFSQKDIKSCQRIFHEGMMNELNFFRSACGQKPIADVSKPTSSYATIHSITVSSSNGSSSAKKSFTESLFDDPISKKIRQEVLRTKFFRGIVANNLAPDAYGGFMVQDAVFIYDVADLLSMAVTNVQRLNLSNFATFYRKKSASFSDYGRYFSENWKILRTSRVNMSVAASTYISYEKELTNNDPKRLVIGLLACSMLWPWLAQEIDAKVPSTHVYRSWVDDNLPSGSSHTQEFVNKFFSQKDIKSCQRIFNEGMMNELNFFRSACGQKPIVDVSEHTSAYANIDSLTCLCIFFLLIFLSNL